VKFGDRTNTYRNVAGKVPQSEARHFNMLSGQENGNPINEKHAAQEYSSRINSLFGENVKERQTAKGESRPFGENVENFYL